MCVALLLSLLLAVCTIRIETANIQQLLIDYTGGEPCQQLLRQRGYINAITAYKSISRRFNQSIAMIDKMVFVGDSTLRTKHDWATTALGHNITMINIDYCDCKKLVGVIANNHRKIADAEVIVWNHGLHILQLEPARKGRLSSLVKYSEELNCMAQAISDAFAAKMIFYKLSNTICEEKFQDRYAVQVNNWLHSPTKTALPNYSLQFSSVGTRFLNYIEKQLPRKYNFTLLNHMVSGACSCTRNKDGRHFKPIVPQFWQHLLEMVATERQRRKLLL